MIYAIVQVLFFIFIFLSEPASIVECIAPPCLQQLQFIWEVLEIDYGKQIAMITANMELMGSVELDNNL